MSEVIVREAARQIEICNACRYCEGYCSVFPAIHKQRQFSDGDIIQLANLCHNCRACYYACQYIEPHQFAINLPEALAEVRHYSWKKYAWPGAFARLLDSSGLVITAVLVLAFSFFFWLANNATAGGGNGFYGYISHGMMVAIFTPAFFLPLVSIGISLRRYWRDIKTTAIDRDDLGSALTSVATLSNLSGGQGQGCNYESEDRFSNARRYFHQATLYGFLLCFASTSVATLMHYLFAIEAPYPLLSLPKVLGISGGILLCIGTAGLAWLKTRADRKPEAANLRGGEMAFILLLFSVSSTGLFLYAATDTELVKLLLPLHLGTVLTLFVLTPYSKMAHGFYRLTALVGSHLRGRSDSPFGG